MKNIAKIEDKLHSLHTLVYAHEKPKYFVKKVGLL